VTSDNALIVKNSEPNFQIPKQPIIMMDKFIYVIFEVKTSILCDLATRQPFSNGLINQLFDIDFVIWLCHNCI
jgi:hypothetical protein